MAHEPTAHLARLVERLQRTGRVYLHVDARRSLAPFLHLPVTFVEPRVEVWYPGFSLVEAGLVAAEVALADGACRATWLTQSHYPLVSDPTLAALGADGQADLLMVHDAPDASIGKPAWRFERRFVRSRNPDGRWHALKMGVVARVRPRLDYRAALGPLALNCGGAAWSLSAPTLQAVLEDFRSGAPHVAYFKAISSPSESYIHTVVANCSTHLEVRDISYSAWDGGQHPAPLTEQNLRAAVAGRFLFAKKFTDDHPELVDLVDALTKGSLGPDQTDRTDHQHRSSPARRHSSQAKP